MSAVLHPKYSETQPRTTHPPFYAATSVFCPLKLLRMVVQYPRMPNHHDANYSLAILPLARKDGLSGL